MNRARRFLCHSRVLGTPTHALRRRAPRLVGAITCRERPSLPLLPLGLDLDRVGCGNLLDDGGTIHGDHADRCRDEGRFRRVQRSEGEAIALVSVAQEGRVDVREGRYTTPIEWVTGDRTPRAGGAQAEVV